MTSAPLLGSPPQQGMYDYGALHSIEKCNTDELTSSWLSQLALKDFSAVAGSFKEHDISGLDVVYLDNSDLQVLCAKLGDRKKILRSLHELKNAKVMEKKHRIVGKFYGWEPWLGFCVCCDCHYENTRHPVIVLPTTIKFKEIPLKTKCQCDCFTRERHTDSIGVGQIQDLSVRQSGWSACDNDCARSCFGCPFGEITILSDNETNPEATFRLRYSEVTAVERIVRDAMEADSSGQNHMQGILADKRS